MYSTGLKLNIGVTLALLLAIGMIMVNFVISILWIHDLVAAEVARGRELVSFIGNHLTGYDFEDNSPTSLPAALPGLLRGTGALCAVVQLGQRSLVVGEEQQCREPSMTRLLRQSSLSGTTEHCSFGPGWGVFTPANQYLAVAAPLRVAAGSATGSVGLILPLAPHYRSVWTSQQYVFTYIGINLGVLTLIGLLRMIKLTIRPVEKLVTLSESYSDRDDIPLFLSGERNEFGQLSMALNNMLWRIEENRRELRTSIQSLREANQKLHETQREMIQTEKLASIGRLAAGLAHEIGNPIAIVQGYLGLLEGDDLRQEEKLDFISRAEKELQRISGLIRQLLDFSRPASGSQQEVAIHPLLADVAGVVSAQPMLLGIKITTNFQAERDLVLGDPDQLRQVFLNCLLNAADAIAALHEERPGLIAISTELRGDNSLAKLVIHFQDNGVGIDPEGLENIFDPFFTTKEPGKGTGLGLSVSHSLITGMGGRISALSGAGGGAEISIELPLLQPAGLMVERAVSVATHHS